ncbi:MAG TPA: (d)CMP kinase [Dehalococcoidia bacterium]|nr:(d)CMP kinase [Dehalococcoidia bacterium]
MGEAAAAVSGKKGKASREAPSIPRVIAIDGPAAAGKSTVGRRVAARLGYPFLDTGAMYRATTWIALHRGVDLSDDDALSELAASIHIDVGPPGPDSAEPCSISVDGEDVTGQLRRPEVEAAVSLVSREAGVRTALVKAQRDLAGRKPVVMAGRDIGTVVLPAADLKVYLDASLEERARRRCLELATLGQEASPDAVLNDLRRRDRIDSERSVSPLRPADDAVRIDTDGLTLDDVVEEVLALAGVPR